LTLRLGGVAERGSEPCLYVIAGANGAGKSDVIGSAIEAQGIRFFNPDRVVRELLQRNPSLSREQLNGEVWYVGKARLEQAIAERLTFAFETTLGGKTIAGLLEKALDAGLAVRIWFTGLANPELHIARVRARVARGGHPVDEALIRQRYDSNRENLIRLLPKLTELKVLDNSAEVNLEAGEAPRPVLVLHWERGRIVGPPDLRATPEWAKAIVAVALRLTSAAR
jgi:predicted ABC-type ATPase